MSTRTVVFATYGGEIPVSAAASSHIRKAGYKVNAWVVNQSDKRQALRTAAFDNVWDLTEFFSFDSADTSLSRVFQEAKALEAKNGSPYFHRDAILDRNVTGFTGADVDLGSYETHRHRWTWSQLTAFALHIDTSANALLGSDTICVVGETNKLWSRSIYRCCQRLGIPHLYPQSLPHGGDRLWFARQLGAEWKDCLDRYERFVESGVPDGALRTEAVAQLRRVCDGELAANLSSLPHGPRRSRDKLRLSALRENYRRYAASFSEDQSHSPYGLHRELVSPAATINRSLRAPSRARFYHRVAHSTLPSGKFVSYFLHVQPEWTVESLAFEYQDQIAAIRQIASYLPADHTLVVKEHPHDGGHRSKHFYGLLASIPGVILLNHSTNGRAVLRGSAAVVTLTGTVTLEAICIGIPVIVLGDIYYRHFRGVQSPATLDRLGMMMLHPEDLERATEAEAVAMLAARMDAAWDGIYPGDPTDRTNSHLIARAILEASGEAI